ncbi:MAG: hypothetical protein AAGA06_01270 [Pseudomonadota bacterium]
MELIYAVAGIALVIFYIGYGTGYTPADDDMPRLRGIGSVLVGGVLCLIIWGAASGARAPAAGVMAFLFLAVFAALFLFGLGRVLGSLVPMLFPEGPRRIAAVLLTMGPPAALMAWAIYSVTIAEADLQARNTAARDVIQTRMHQARFGPHEITFPGAPALHILHPCSNRSSRCRTMFWDSPGWNNRPEGPLELFALGLVTHPTVLEAQEHWCARPDVPSGGIWCTLAEADDMRFKRADEVLSSEASRETRCGSTHTGRIACNLTHDVGAGAVAILHSLADDEGAARAAIRDKRDRADAIWASMTGSAQP